MQCNTFLATALTTYTIQLDATGNYTLTSTEKNAIVAGSIGSDLSFTFSQETFTCANISSVNITVTIADACTGSSEDKTITITVQDTVNPTAVTKNITVQLDASGSANITPAQINNGSSDNCSIDTMTLDKTTFDCSNIGANTVTLTVKDINGNADTKTVVVTIEGSITPIANCVAPFVIQLDDSGIATITASDINNNSTDNCEISSIQIDKDSFDCSNIGENIITLTITDVNNNSTTCSTTVTVEDTSVPLAITKDITVSLDANGSATITPEDVDNGSFDACGIASMTLDQTTFNCPTLTEHTVTLTVTDNNGLSSTMDAVITFTASDIDNDNIADTCDNDMDGDGVANNIDNCPETSNSGQEDIDRNGIGDVCDEGALIFPKGFSPNGDNINDTFIINGIHKFPNNSLEVYNRWGNKVHYSKDYQNYWNGVASTNSSLLPAAPYFYVLSIDDGKKVYKGWVYINY